MRNDKAFDHSPAARNPVGKISDAPLQRRYTAIFPVRHDATPRQQHHALLNGNVGQQQIQTQWPPYGHSRRCTAVLAAPVMGKIHIHESACMGQSLNRGKSAVYVLLS